MTKYFFLFLLHLDVVVQPVDIIAVLFLQSRRVPFRRGVDVRNSFVADTVDERERERERERKVSIREKERERE
jgi:hypothetical protein